MAGNTIKTSRNQEYDVIMSETIGLNQLDKAKEVDRNEELAYRTIQAAVSQGVSEFCICPGARNSPFLPIFKQNPQLKTYFWFEERSAAFFALGRSKQTQRPVAVITTSGSAAGELLPAAMEAYYTAIPLLLITADRPRRFRGSGAPQSAEQVGLFGQYATFQLDIAENDNCDLKSWSKNAPGHLNVCFEEPKRKFSGNAYPLEYQLSNEDKMTTEIYRHLHLLAQRHVLNDFLELVNCPLVVVSTLKPQAQETVAQFLVKLNAPVILEGVSGLREDSRLQHLKINRTENLWNNAKAANYPIDGILRIGGVPTFRLWRDLEEKQSTIKVCSISDVPFSGLSWAGVVPTDIDLFLADYPVASPIKAIKHDEWLRSDNIYFQKLLKLFEEEPKAEASLMHQLSRIIPKGSRIYLGNSLPIREWDLAATCEAKEFIVNASRGINGIDGQISTCLGLAKAGSSNWGIFGDLTTLYDMAGLWILSHLENLSLNLVVINNGGGKIFDRMFEDKAMLNAHGINFEPLAKLWSLPYEQWRTVPLDDLNKGSRIIEIVPDNEASNRFLDKLAKL